MNVNRTLLREIINKIKSNHDVKKDEKLVEPIISLVQSMEHKGDVTYKWVHGGSFLGYDKVPYIKFPYETLYDNGGNSLDLAILLSALLREFDYSVSYHYFVNSNQVAAGIRCKNIEYIDVIEKNKIGNLSKIYNRTLPNEFPVNPVRMHRIGGTKRYEC